MREGLSVSVCRHWYQTLCKLLQSETLRWWALQGGTYYWAERKWTFSLSQMGKASCILPCEKRCMKWTIRWGVVNRVSSHVKSQSRTVLATSNAITCLWHCGMRHRGGRTENHRDRSIDPKEWTNVLSLWPWNIQHLLKTTSISSLFFQNSCTNQIKP